MTKEELQSSFFQVRDCVHYLHLQTTSFAEHKALGKYYESWIDLADTFLESFYGKYGRITQPPVISVGSNMGSVEYLKGVQQMLTFDARKILLPTDTELNNILDEMLALTDQTLYLLSLK